MIIDSICMTYMYNNKIHVFFLSSYKYLLLDENSKILELSCFSLLDTAILPTSTKPKTLQTEEVSTTGNNHNITANTSQDREFILFKNERIALMLFAC